MIKTNSRIFWKNPPTNLPQLNLLDVQKDSYQWFLGQGIKEALASISPIFDFTGKNWQLEFGEHSIGQPKYSANQALKKDLTYEIPLKVKAQLTNLQTGEVIKQEVFMGDIPQMTDVGTFIINGIERSVVNQLVRSPGVFFSGTVDLSTGRSLYQAELRPLRGSWLEINVSRYNTISVKIDRHRKLPATTFLRAIRPFNDEELLKIFNEVDSDQKYPYILSTLEKDPTKTHEEALIEIYQKMRPGEPAVLENAKELLQRMFFDPKRYDLGDVGRYKTNRRLKLNLDLNTRILTPDDIIASIKYLIALQNGQGRVDDIDSLSNRRVRRVGELVVTSAFRVGLLRLERSIREKMSLAKADVEVTPSTLVNPRPVIASVSDFFRRNRLSTILDQTNPLAEIDNLRRLSVMGPGGVTRERASFSMRDINSSQYGRICPVRSPEGPNIGLVTYLALYARVNQFGFLETPYRKVVKETKNNKIKMRVTEEIVYLASDEEENHYITHAEIPVDKQGYIVKDWVPARYQTEFMEISASQIEYIDVVPRQVVGTSASLIPFIAHDEANRALMGTHMQCQAVPLVNPESPIVGTGMETKVVSAIKRTVQALVSGTVTYVDSQKITIRTSPQDVKKLKDLKLSLQETIIIEGSNIHYQVIKFSRTTQSTCYSQKPLVAVGDKVKPGDLIIDGPACDHGELALGQNLTIAYMSYEGLGYEDAVIISDRLVKEDILTSVMINEYEAKVMDTKLGPEELTRDIPNVGETELSNLGDDGIVVIGSQVEPNDILVGKIAPKGETELTAEERLLRAIFGEKAREVRDTSLRVPHGEGGTVIEVKVFDRDKGDELDPGVIKKVIVQVAQMRKIVVGDKLAGRHGNKGVISKIVPVADMPYFNDGTPVDIIISPLSVLARMNLGQLLEAQLGWAAKKLGKKFALPVFEPIDESLIIDQLKKAHLPVSGKTQLFDGRTGESFVSETAVGVAYFLKLIHMVEDKTHARSTGPYSLVTQQPLGGKAQMGGQRLGEMEVWALEAHRAAHTLQEMLTIKSDDVVGRAKAFEAIVKSLDIPEATVPESFRVLVKELQSLCLNIIPGGVTEEELKEDEDDEKEKTNE
ncbi:MAG: DNA-directed RNA polymerase subunit beta [Candidatus Beckwithbacteria bacterium GW2011_GWA2_43_10]|uniref:DNA-directed RNA polymerase subunit beta n=1 Tax=Candidatus Beckwithbacteria bacterium GW2011_GWA2_43_10 TaxID=1618369 RepID=A0A0G1C3K3_9BACT|nr:MAG: DNA-directed RNA polymerase subunit beta [Candidatus Beckwithbacteria bacterium GW2011_GWA2_43_10]